MIWSKSATYLIAATLLGLGAEQQSGTPPSRTEADAGLIDGTVIYEDGRPVKGATVYAVPLGRAMAAIIPHADTDEAGFFAIRISRSWFGKFAVAAKKEDEDYPDMSKQFYSDGKFETATLTSRLSTATVKIRLGPKAGVLRGTVTDAVTSAPLSPCVEFRRASEPNNFLSGSGLVNPTYSLLVPSDTGILIRIWLDGYKSWYYPGTLDKSARKAVRLKPGEEETMDVLLQPDSGNSQSGCPSRLKRRSTPDDSRNPKPPHHSVSLLRRNVPCVLYFEARPLALFRRVDGRGWIWGPAPGRTGESRCLSSLRGIYRRT
jgi:hypothetical protein